MFVGSQVAPQNVSVTPDNGTSLVGAPRIFTTVYRDANGANDLRDCRLMIDSELRTSGSPAIGASAGSGIAVNALLASYNLGTNRVFLRNDADTGWVNPNGYTPGALGYNLLQNSRGVLNVQNMVVTRAGTDITILWSWTPKASFAGQKNLYLSCTDAAGASDGPEDMGDWGVFNSAASGAIISEFRFRGPNGSADEYVELFNTLRTPLDISGWSIQTNTGTRSNPAIQTSVVPASTVIPAFGHFLFAGSAYSLSAYGARDAAIAGDISDSSGVALLNFSNAAQDAVGFVGSLGTLREGSGLSSAPVGDGEAAFMRDYNNSMPKNNEDSSADFVFLEPNPPSSAPTPGTEGGVFSRLGAPSPQGLTSPFYVNHLVTTLLLDPFVSQNLPPNRVREGSGDGGTLLIRRTLVNKTGKTLNRVRFGVTRITSLGSPTYFANQADIRLATSSDETVLFDNGDGTSTPVEVFGTALETGATGLPLQPLGGGLGSSTSFTSVLSTPLAPFESRSYSFLLQIVKSGNFSVIFNIEALPAP